ncbi:MAG: metallophosphoesterase family protein [Anaerolineae bacterium]|nr:metallophosphoesterase family protein [Anaerolineae bacterium]
MLTHVRQVMLFLIWHHPGEIVAGAALLSVAGIVVGAGTLVLLGQRQEARVLTVGGLPLTLAFSLFCLADWALLWALPRLRLSFSPNIEPPLITSLFVRLLVFWGLVGAALLAHWRAHRRGVEVRTRSAVILFLLVNLGFSAVQVDAYVVEPLLVETTRLSFAFDDLDPGAPPVRIVHITDTHIERSSFREKAVVRKVNALHPDIIILTGDYLNLSYLSDPTSAAHFRQFAAQLEAGYGIYGVRGSVEPTLESMAWLVEGTDIVWLEQETVTVDVRGQPVTLIGVACSHQQELDVSRLAQAMDGVSADAFTLLLYHSPDLIREAAEHQIDLYLGGHTHGGQLRLPFYGAIITNSIYGRRYAAGLFAENGATMYISRGLGFGSGGMPRARFLCRPEIVSLELSGSE